MEPLDKELAEEKFKGVYARIDSSHDLLFLEIKKSHEILRGEIGKLMIVQNQTLDQTKKTNGRVTKLETETVPKLENETRIWRAIQNNPKLVISSIILPVLGFIAKLFWP